MGVYAPGMRLAGRAAIAREPRHRNYPAQATATWILTFLTIATCTISCGEVAAFDLSVGNVSADQTVRGWVEILGWMPTSISTLSSPPRPTMLASPVLNESGHTSAIFRIDPATAYPVLGWGGMNESWVRAAAAQRRPLEGDVIRSTSNVSQVTNLRFAPGPWSAADESPLPSLGTVSVLAARVTMCGVKPAVSDRLMQETFFTSRESVANNSNYCSHGRFRIDKGTSRFVDIDVGCPYPGALASTCIDDIPSITGEGDATSHLEYLSQQAIQALGHDLNAHRFLVLIWPLGSCYWWAHAYMGARMQTVLSGYGFTWDVVMHEFGHNLGFDHESDGVSATSGGSGPHCYNLAEQWAVGWDDPVGIDLQPGMASVRRLPNYITSATAGWKVSIPGYQDWYFYVSFVADADHNTGALEASVANRMMVTVWNEPRFKPGWYSAATRWALLAQKESWGYEDLVFQLHEIIVRDGTKTAVASVCRKSSRNSCSLINQKLMVSEDIPVLIGYEMKGAGWGYIEVDSAEACHDSCVRTAGCVSWTLEFANRVCWIVEEQYQSGNMVQRSGFAAGYVRTRLPTSSTTKSRTTTTKPPITIFRTVTSISTSTRVTSITVRQVVTKRITRTISVRAKIVTRTIYRNRNGLGL